MKYQGLARALAAALGLAACTGVIDEQRDPGGAPAPPGPPAPETPRPAGPPAVPAAPPGTAAPAPTGPQPTPHLHRLTAREFANSLRDLLGPDVPIAPVDPDQESDGLYSVGASVLAVSPAGVARYETAVGQAVDRALADATRAAKVVPCVPQAATDTACATRVINGLGRRAFRRPLTAAETARYLGVFQAIAAEAGSSPLVGVRYALMAVLQSPSFLYRVELGTPSTPDRGRPKYTGFEMASRLAALLWQSVPDDALMDAAAADRLATAEGVRAEATRLLAHANARRAFRDYVEDLYGAEHLEEALKDTAVFKTWTPTLRDAMREDLTRRLDDAAFGAPADVLALYDSPFAFVNNELARLYGVPAVMPDAFRRVELPAASPRRGLATSGAVLAAYALPQRTSPTARGKFIAEVLLCKTVPLPPPGVDAVLEETDPTATVREQLEKHRKDPSCAACHALMDPIGLGLESFDGIGAHRTTERGKPIDASGALDGAPFANAAELGTRLREHPAAASCFVRKLYTHAQGRAPLAVDEPALEALSAKFGQGGRRADRLLLELASSDAFRFVEPLARQEQKP